jgi:PAS domain S-box-containing protein
LSFSSFAAENYYLLVLGLQVGVLSALMAYLGRFDPDDARTGAFRRLLIGAAAWAFFDFAVDHWGKVYPDEAAFDLYRYACFLFLFYPPAACELIVSLYRRVTWRIRAWLYGPYLLMYLGALAAPSLVSAQTFGIAGGYSGAPGPWNLVFKVFSSVVVFVLLARLAAKGWRDADPVARREKLVLAGGGFATLFGIIFSEVLRIWLPYLPWSANLATLATTLCAYISLKEYGRVLSPQALYRATVQATPAGMIHLHGNRITWAGPSLTRRLGYGHPDDLVGRPVRDILAESDGPEALAEMVERMCSGRISDEEVRLAGKNGLRAISLASGAALDPADPSQGVLVVFTDISDYKRIEAEREKLIANLREALQEVKTLRGFLPICSHCKKIRDDEGYWRRIEEYIQDRSEAQFSHGICPDCAKTLYPKYASAAPKAGEED